MAKAGTNTTQSLKPVWGKEKKTIKVMVNYPAEKKKVHNTSPVSPY